MDIERVQQLIRGIKVQRTGSEQERRRRRDSDEEFRELLESNLTDEDEQEEPQAPVDTVSITSGEPLAPLVNDLVSISTTARVGAEVASARKSAAEEINGDVIKRSVRNAPDAAQAEPEESNGPPVRAEHNVTDDEDAVPSGFDTVA